MERLTQLNEQGTAYYYPFCFEKCNGMGASEKCNKCELVTNACDKLGAYEDAEEQGLLLRLPCKVGDIIYEPTNRDTINEYRVTGIKKGMFSLWIEWELEEGFIYQSIYGVEVGDIGKTVFLTRQEAEKELADMGV